MARVGIAIDKDWLEEQYITNKRTTPDIAKEVGCSHSYVGNVLKRYGIAVRSAKEAKSMHTNALEYLENKEWLHEQYITLRKSTPTIGKELDCSSTMVASYLTQHEIEIRSLSEANNIGAAYVEDRDWLYEQYITLGKSTTTIGKEIGCTPVTISNWLRTHKIDARNPSEAKAQNVNRDLLYDIAWLSDQYVTKNRSAISIANELGFCDGGPVRAELTKNNIKLKTNAVAQINNIDAIQYLEDGVWMREQYSDKNRSSTSIANELLCTHKTVLRYLHDHNIPIVHDYKMSTPEYEIGEFLSGVGISYINSCRSILTPLELDVYIPDKKIAIELNGVYWHSVEESRDTVENRKKHLYKTEECAKRDITLLHFTCLEWNSKQPIVKSMILNKLGITAEKIFARKCTIAVVTKEEQKIFFGDNHIQGYANSTICYGLLYGGEYVCMISFGRPRYNQAYSYEIIRIATKMNTNVVGGASRLFSKFIRDNNPISIITYADRRYSTGKIYEVLGFEFSHNSDIGYRWVKNGVEYNRMQFQRHKLQDKIKHFDESKSSTQNMFDNGYRKLYDCGQAAFVMNRAL
jgi:hypothetical protein